VTIGRRASEVAASIAALAVALVALLALGWSGSPVRLHAPGAALWAGIAAVVAVVELQRARGDAGRSFLASAALCLAFVALAEAAIVFVSFAPCGSKCL
jgi:hypothetical protein